jgi:hypothetical protein
VKAISAARMANDSRMDTSSLDNRCGAPSSLTAFS